MIFNDASQGEIFDEMVKPHIINAFEGVNSTFILTGYSGSGKSFTLDGPCGIKDLEGILPRSLRYFFELKPDTSSLYLSVGELYLNSYYNLCDKDSKKLVPSVKIPDNLPEYLCKDLDTALKLYCTSTSRRESRPTRINKHSSRSHYIAKVKIVQADKCSSVTYVDFAGYECPTGTGCYAGIELDEQDFINSTNTQLKEGLSCKKGGVELESSLIAKLLNLDEDDNNIIICLLISNSESNLQQSEEYLEFFALSSASPEEKMEDDHNSKKTSGNIKESVEDKDAEDV